MAQANPPSRRFGDFEIIEQLGRGGSGTVFKARDTTLGGRIVALKVLNADLADDPDWVRRFQREASIAANMDHPNIPVIHRFGEVGGRHYIAMRFVPGQTLAVVSRDTGPMAVDRMVALLEPVAEALDYAHGQGVVHRDLKPGNILVEPNGWMWLTDFGLARPVSVTGAGGTVTNTLANLAGTLPYLSPEQFQDETPGPASDRYALGVTAYELLTRRYPFEATNPVALGLKVVANAPPPVRGLRPDVPEHVERAVARMLAKAPGDRFGTSASFVRVLAGGSQRVASAPPARVIITPPPPREEITRSHPERRSRPLPPREEITPLPPRVVKTATPGTAATSPASLESTAPPDLPAGAPARVIITPPPPREEITPLPPRVVKTATLGTAATSQANLESTAPPDPPAGAPARVVVPPFAPVDQPKSTVAVGKPGGGDGAKDTGAGEPRLRMQSRQWQEAPLPGPQLPRLVVDPSGQGDHRTIKAAIRASVVPGTLITVKPGIYREALVIDRDVEIVGEGDRALIVVEVTDAWAVTVTAGRAVVRNLTVRAVGTKARLGAVSVQRGRVVIEGCDLTSAIGAVVYITGKDSSPVIRDCSIRDGKGSGVYVQEQGQGTIEKCVISGNAFAGVEISEGGNPVIRDCEIRDGKSGGVFVSTQGQGTIERCVISGNAFAGVQISEGGNPVVRDCEIRDGQESGVFVHDQGQGTIERCVISGNAFAGVDIITGGNPVVRDCKILDGKESGVFVWEQGQGTFTGNTLTGNARGAWVIKPDAGMVIRTGNRPDA